MSIRNRVRHASLIDRLRRYPRRGWIAGVCAGLAEFFDWNVKLIRVLFVGGFFVSGFFPVGVAYLVLWYLMDEADAPAPRGHGGDVPPPHEPPRRGPRDPDVGARFSRLEQRLRNMEDCVTSSEFELRRELRKLET